MRLTENFTLEEFEKSKRATANGIYNKIPEHYLEKVYWLARVLQIIRDEFGKPIKINSGYRCEQLNNLVKGSKSSQHLTASAADITSSNNARLFAIILKLIDEGKIEVGQLIWEYGNKSTPAWIHISIPNGCKHNQVLFFYN